MFTQSDKRENRRWRWVVAAGIIASLVSALLILMLAQPAPGVQYPASYREDYAHYARVDRSDGTFRNFYISPEAVDAIRRGRALPDGTVIVLEGFDVIEAEDGALTEPHPALHVSEKRSNWRDADYAGAARAGRWNYGAFDRQSGEPVGESLSACANCHNAAEESDFLYTLSALERYSRTGEVQHSVCDLPGRIAC